MAIFNKVNVGKVERNATIFNVSRDVHTTSNFGFMQPTGCIEVTPADEKITISGMSATRCAPLVCPSYAKIKTKQYFRFVPMHEVQKNWDELLTGQTVETSQMASGYVPQRVPSIRVCDLSYLLLCFSKQQEYYKDQGYWKYSTPPTTYVSENYMRFLPVLNRAAAITAYKALLDTYDPQPAASEDSDGWMHPQFADYVLPPQSKTDGTATDKSDADDLIFFYLTPVGHNIRKILIGLGYQIDFTNEQYVSLLPLFAYYKAYYDLMYINRRHNWHQTKVYRLIDTIYQYALAEINTVDDRATGAFNQLAPVFSELADCYYNTDPDYFTSQNDQPAMTEIGTYAHTVKPNVLSTNPSSAALTNSGSVQANNSQPVLIANSSASTSVLGIAQLKIAQQIYKLVNSESVIGGKIKDLLENKFGAECFHPEDSYAFGQTEYMQSIDDVVATAQTDAATLGDYTGLGRGADKSFSHTFNAGRYQQFGYIISFLCVVPECKYVQGLDRMLYHGTVGREDFYTPAYDGIGFQLTTRGEYLGSREVCKSSALAADGNAALGYGFAPRYLEYKTNPHNIANGYISSGSHRDYYLPYMLDRWFTPSRLSWRKGTTPGNAGFSELAIVDGYEPGSVDASQRMIGRSAQLGNFNRIFQAVEYDQYTGTSHDVPQYNYDNFIVHCIFNIKRYSKMIPVQDSYETFGNALVAEHQ